MNFTTCLLSAGLGLLAIIGDKDTAKDIVPKLYEEIGCMEVNEGELIFTV